MNNVAREANLIADGEHPGGVDAPRDFQEFFLASWPRLMRSTYAVTRDHQRAEDAVQVAFAQAHARWGRVSRVGDPLAYVRRIAFHQALSQRRLAFRRREVTTAALSDLAMSTEQPNVEARLDLWEAIGRLPARQRAVVVLRYYEDLSERQIAETLGIRPGTVKSQASAALATLRGHLHDTARKTQEEGIHD